ncbi:transcription termination factor Rho [Tsukamurella pseudospumae]|uniref:Transcription termination factor Rho n=1 Tax=Tsukamurella pseudospumae TaxID=239498 RepID=A0A137YSD9_9ACTN|nr:transcription termination factor Rho [Tsukamurella pseudospumae]KXO88828.1 transcription termination factor Rho [Tsukamurella pseudospumae]
MTETDVTTSPEAGTATVSSARADERRRSGLNGMVLAELRGIASELGIKGISGLRKGDLIAAITAQQGGGAAPAKSAAKTTKAASKADAPKADAPKTDAPKADAPKAETPKNDTPKAETPKNDAPKADADKAEAPQADRAPSDAPKKDAPQGDAPKNDGEQGQQREGGQRRERNQRRNQNQDGENRQQGDRQQGENRQDRQQGDRQQGENRQRNQGNNQGGQGNNQGNRNQNNGPEDDGDGTGRRGRRFRERRRGRDRGQNDGEPQVSEDDVLQPVAGILDVLDNYAFVRTSGYIAGPNDVYVSMNMIRRNGLRRGDAITGAVKMPREGESNNNDGGGNQGGGGGGRGNQNNRQKFNPLVRLDSVNGQDVDSAKNRPEFNKLTPLYPNQRLRLETAQNILTTRVIDLIMPIGKGQRALISAPPKAGKTTVLQDIANAIATNNPECYLMVVLVDERPEEVTDMQRSVRGEVISSTFDRPPSDHTSVAELAIERAKRLVEGGKDVVVLLDSITRLGRAYNNSSPASGRILSGGIDSTALYPPKRFLGAARNIENGGSLTIIATALVETGSTGDTVIFEEFKGTGNAELKLDRKISERRVFPAVDVAASNTRKDELIMAPDEAAVVNKLRRLLAALDGQQAIDLLISQLKKTQNNIEFLMTVQKNSGFADND